ISFLFRQWLPGAKAHGKIFPNIYHILYFSPLKCQHNNINHETAKQQNAAARTRKFVIFFLSRTVYPCHNRFRSVMPVFFAAFSKLYMGKSRLAAAYTRQPPVVRAD